MLHIVMHAPDMVAAATTHAVLYFFYETMWTAVYSVVWCSVFVTTTEWVSAHPMCVLLTS